MSVQPTEILSKCIKAIRYEHKCVSQYQDPSTLFTHDHPDDTLTLFSQTVDPTDTVKNMIVPTPFSVRHVLVQIQ